MLWISVQAVLLLTRTWLAQPLTESGVSEENRRYFMGENFHDRYNFYNARIDFIFGERGVLVVYSKRIKKDGDISIISI